MPASRREDVHVSVEETAGRHFRFIGTKVVEIALEHERRQHTDSESERSIEQFPGPRRDWHTMTPITYPTKKKLAYRIRHAKAQSDPASQSNLTAARVFHSDALTVYSSTHGTTAHRKISVPPHG
jgi:hypothetical protein